MTACGAQSGVKNDDPIHGVWRASTGEMLGISMALDEFFETGFTIELKPCGRCAIDIDGQTANGEWALDNGVFTVKGGGIDSKGRMEEGRLSLEFVLGTGLTLVFEKDGP